MKHSIQKTDSKPVDSLFPLTQTYPQFFNNNLVDDNRVIKLLKGEKSCLRAFYYQLFKLAFEIQIQPAEDDSHQNQIIDYVALTKNILTTISQKHKILEFSVEKIKNFMNFIVQNPRLSFEIQIELDPSLDKAMITILESFLDEQNISENLVQEIFFYLSNIFHISVTQYENCLKFSQSDVFIYIENEQQFYLAYLDVNETDALRKRGSEKEEQEKELIVKNSKEPSSSSSESESKIPQKNQQFQKEKAITEKNDTIMNLFGDMLYSSRNDGTSRIFGTDSIHGTHNFHTSPPKQQIKRIPEQVNLENQNKNDDNDNSDVDHYALQHSKNVSFPKKVSEEQVKRVVDEEEKNDEEEELFYKPKLNMRPIPEVSSPRDSMLRSKLRKDPLDYNDSGEKGTFYRQFTDTRILNILPEPHRTKVKILKNRFIGVHSNLKQ